MFHHILLVLDGSTAGEAAVPLASSLAAQEGARLTLLRVVSAACAYPHGRLTAALAAEEVRTALAYLHRVMRRTGLEVERVGVTVLTGSLPRAALRYACAQGIDLIVVGQDPSREWPDRVVPTATEHLVGRAPCPVLVVPAGAFVEAERAPELCFG